MLSLFLTIACSFVLLGFALHKNKGNFPISLLLLLFATKVGVGCLYGWYFSKAPYETDTWKFHTLALAEYNWLLQDPILFWKDLVTHGYTVSQHNTFFDTHQSYWKDLPNNIFVKLLACFNIVTKGKYYYNVLLINSISMLGIVYLLKIIQRIEPIVYKTLACCIVLMPPIIFFSSGLHKDTLLFIGLILLVHSVLRFIEYQKIHYAITFFLAFAFVFLTKNVIAITIAIGIPFFIFFYRTSIAKYKIILLQIVIFISGVAITNLLPPSINILEKIAEKQNSFLLLEGSTSVTNISLQPTFNSYILYLPTAIKTAFFEPNFWSFTGAFQFGIALYNIALILCVVLSVIYIKKTASTIHPIWMWLLPFVLINYLLIGYTVTFSGAVIRYRLLLDIWGWIFCFITIQHYLSKKLLVK